MTDLDATVDPVAPPTSSSTPLPLGRQPDFRRLWVGYGVSAVGSEVTLLAVPMTAAVLLHGSPFQMGLLTAAGTLPNLALGLLAGVWVDRLPRRRPVLIAADLLAAAFLVTVPVMWLLGLLTFAHLVVVELAVGACRVVFRPAYQAHLPDAVARAQVIAASARLRGADSVAMLAGPGLGGLLVQVLSAPLALLFDAASFVASALCINAVRAREHSTPAHREGRSVRSDLAEGLRTVLRDKSLRAIAGAAANLNLFGMLVMALFVVYATRDLGFSAGYIGATMLLGGVGALFGAALAPRVAAALGAGRTITAASVVFSFALFALPLARGPHWVELLTIGVAEMVAGIAVMLFDVTVNGFVLTRVPTEVLGRVSASMAFLTQGVKPLGALLGGVLGSSLGLEPALWVAAVGATSTMLWTLCSPLRGDQATS